MGVSKFQLLESNLCRLVWLKQLLIGWCMGPFYCLNTFNWHWVLVRLCALNRCEQHCSINCMIQWYITCFFCTCANTSLLLHNQEWECKLSAWWVYFLEIWWVLCGNFGFQSQFVASRTDYKAVYCILTTLLVVIMSASLIQYSILIYQL